MKTVVGIRKEESRYFRGYLPHINEDAVFARLRFMIVISILSLNQEQNQQQQLSKSFPKPM